MHNREAGTIRGLLHHKRAVLLVLGFTAGGSLIFYTFTTYMQKYLVNTAGMEAKTASTLMTVALLVYMLLQPIFGMISDHIGRKNSMICFSSLAVLATVPLLTALGRVADPYAAFGLVLLALAIISFYTSISGLVKAELFPTEVRALGVGLSYAIANALFGGTAEYVGLWFKAVGQEWVFPWYVTALCAVALVASLSMPDTRKRGYLEGQET
jgi:MHS family alpha-ketoglutarate permease-like MFS transporter